MRLHVAYAQTKPTGIEHIYALGVLEINFLLALSYAREKL